MRMNSLFMIFCVIVLLGLAICINGSTDHHDHDHEYDDHHDQHLRKNFYADTCPHVEDIVRFITWDRVAKNSSLASKFLRMYFHDCFVRGCDASVLLDSTKNNTAEKDGSTNRGLAGTFGVINEIKDYLEHICPGVVSCADILALVARDSVSYQFKRPMWEVETGRRDGRVSKASEISSNIPAPTFNYTSLVKSFANKTLDAHDLVVLLGGHTIGKGHCNFFSNRLYNFTGKGDADPSLSPAYAAFLRTKCRSLSDNVTTVDLDPRSALSFDTAYYRALKYRQGLFQSDAALLTNGEARRLVEELESPLKFFKEFGESMQRMGAIGVLTGSHGEIRKKCNVVNY